MLSMHVSITSQTRLNLFILLVKVQWRKASFFFSRYSGNLISHFFDHLHCLSIIRSLNNIGHPFTDNLIILWISSSIMVISPVGRWNVLVFSDHLSINSISSSLSTQTYVAWRSHPIPRCWSTLISSFKSLSFITRHFFQLQDIGSGSMRNWWYCKHKPKKYALVSMQFLIKYL